MNDHRQIVLARELQLRVKEVRLLVRVQAFDEKIEPDFSDRDQPGTQMVARTFADVTRGSITPGVAVQLASSAVRACEGGRRRNSTAASASRSSETAS